MIITDNGLAKRLGEEVSVYKGNQTKRINGKLGDMNGGYYVTSYNVETVIKKGDVVGLSCSRKDKSEKGLNFYKYAGR